MTRGLSHLQLMQHFEDKFLKTGRAAYRPATDSWTLNGEGSTIGNLRAALVFSAEHTTLVKATTIIQIKSAEYQKKEREHLEAWAKAPPKSDDTTLHSWVRLMERKNTSKLEHDAHVWALKQWMWQVKRHILDMPVTWHVLPIFWSRENGTGKSFNVKRIMEPVSEFTRSLNVSDLSDKFSASLFSRTRIAFFDEFAGAEGVDLGIFKSMVTGRAFEGRAMYSESGFHARNRTSFIATSNKVPPHGLEDESGARRLWSIHCSGDKAHPHDWRGQMLDIIDPKELWDCVDVHWDSVFEHVPTEVAEFMDNYRERYLRTAGSLEAFCKDYLQPGHESDRLRLRTLVSYYHAWCDENAQTQVKCSQDRLTSLLKDLDYTVVNCQNIRYIKGHLLRRDSDLNLIAAGV